MERYGGTEFGGSDLIEKKKLDVVCSRCGTGCKCPSALHAWSCAVCLLAVTALVSVRRCEAADYNQLHKAMSATNEALPGPDGCLGVQLSDGGGAGLRLMTSVDVSLLQLTQANLAMAKSSATLLLTSSECVILFP